MIAVVVMKLAGAAVSKDTSLLPVVISKKERFIT
jgi:hypothetical protein